MLTKLIKQLKGSSPAAGDNNIPEPTAAKPTWQPGDIILERYRVDEVHGGAMGLVYIAWHLGWNIPVAIKTPRPEVLAVPEGARRVLTEADSWVRMGMHPNIATCFYVLNIDEIPYLFIEYVDGGDLQEWIRSGRCRDPRTNLSLAIQFCHGMEFTHSKGIIHRDIKPQNILLTKNALLKITDFGIIQTGTGNTRGAEFSTGQAGTVVTAGFRGTPGYASPEQLLDAHRIDKRSDIFSFGICLWLMFCGRKPYANNAVRTPAAFSTSESKLHPSLKRILLKATAFEPAARYQNFSALRQDLNQAHIDLFKISCPYMQINFDDIQAENLNNRAVSCLELGRKREAAGLLNRALDNNDTLPEAIYNFTLLKWKEQGAKPDYLLRQLEAARQRLPPAAIIDALQQAIKCDILGRAWQQDDETREPRNFFPEYALCPPRNSVEIFRNGQTLLSSRKNIQYLFKENRQADCFQALLKAWTGIGFRRDKVFIDIYEKLYPEATTGNIKGVIRIATIPAQEATTKGMLYLPGADKVLSLSKSGRVTLRSYSRRARITALGKLHAVRNTALSRDGTLLGLGGRKGVINIISLPDGGKRQYKIPGLVTALAFSPDNQRLSVGSDTGLVQTFNFSGGSIRHTEAAQAGPIRSLIYFNKGLDFVTGSENGTLHFWDQEGGCTRMAAAHAMPVTTLAAAANGLSFISAAADRIIKVWDRQSGQCRDTIQAHDDRINAAFITGDNKYIISGCDDDLIKIWDIKESCCKYIMDGRGDGIRSLCPGPRPYIFLAGRNDGAIVIWMMIYELCYV
ncbi:protein kinase domain-containing protein [Desulfobacterota bacterium M19]